MTESEEMARPDYEAELEAVKGRRGRRTKREETLLLLSQLGLPPSLADKLELGPTPKGPAAPLTVRETAELVLTELGRRLADPVERAKLPGTKLLDLAEKMRPLLEAEQAAAVEGPGAPELTVAEIIAGIEGLPDVRKREILEGERALLRAELAAIDAQLAGPA